MMKMKHIETEKLDIYLLNKSVLSDELQEIEKHLGECEICNKKLNELSMYYGKLNTIENQDLKKPEQEKGKKLYSISNIQERLSGRKFSGIEKTNLLFEKKEKSFNIFKNIINKISVPLKSTEPKGRSTKLVFAYSMGLLIIFAISFVVYYNLILKEKFNKTEYAVKDTFQITEKRQIGDTLIGKDTSSVPENEINTEKEKKTNIKEKRNIFATMISFAALSKIQGKGGNKEKYIMFIHKKFKSASLLVLKDIPDKKDLSSEKISEYYYEGLVKYMIIFPPSKISGVQNKICEVYKDENDLKVTITESGNICSEKQAALLYYTISNEYSDISVKCNSKYREIFAENFNIELQDKQIDESLYKLGSEIRSWNGKENVNGIEKIKNFNDK